MRPVHVALPRLRCTRYLSDFGELIWLLLPIGYDWPAHLLFCTQSTYPSYLASPPSGTCPPRSGVTLILRYGLLLLPFRALVICTGNFDALRLIFLVRLCVWKYSSVCGRLWWFSGRRMWFSTVVPLVPLFLGCCGKFALVPRLCHWFYLGFLCWFTP